MKHILVVDDNKTNLMMAREALCDLYKITAVTMGAQALKFLENNTCDLILLDINMPEMDGFEVMSRIQQMEHCKDIPIIFLTADDDAAVESRCLEEGAQDFIAKPFVKRVMRSRIGRLLELEELRAELATNLEKKTLEVIDIQNKSQKDVLTGLWNRGYAEKIVNEKLENGDHGALFMMDMDNFKAINDNYGHLEGDRTLKMFAETLQTFANEKDVLCRIGGDEFVMYVAGNPDEEMLRRRAKSIIDDMVRKLDECKFETNSSVSVGISKEGTDGSDFKTLYNAADKALYFVKINGKNMYHFYSDQKKIENDRVTNVVDLKQISELLSRSDSGQGVYQLDYDNFHYVFNFIRRFVKRNHHDVHTILFTAHSKYDGAIETEELENAIDTLENAVYKSLRRVDIATRYSTKQMIVMLIDSNEENTDMVARRILDNYEAMYDGRTVTFNYGVAAMEK